jgi:periplasmic protein TonB
MMAAAPNTPFGESMSFGSRKEARKSYGWLIGGAVLGLALLAIVLWPTEQISQRPHDMKTTQVILPPPPPPPPPPEQVVEETPPEPTIAPPLEQPLDTPPPPEASNDPVRGDSALTAREGAGPSNYGLQRGDGGGTRIGGRPGGGGDGFAAYANVALSGIRQAAQGDRELSRGRYTVQLAVAVGSDGRITNVRVIGGGDERRNARLREILTGLQLSQRPPAGLPVMRIELNARSGA